MEIIALEIENETTGEPYLDLIIHDPEMMRDISDTMHAELTRRLEDNAYTYGDCKGLFNTLIVIEKVLQKRSDCYEGK